MPIGKIGGYAGKGGDYSSGSQNIDASKKSKSGPSVFFPLVAMFWAARSFLFTVVEFLFVQTWLLLSVKGAWPFFVTFPPHNPAGATTVSGYQKTDVQHSYGAGALNVEAQTNVPKVKENLSYSKAEGSGTSQYGAGAVGMETAMKAPKLKHEGLGQVDKTKEMVRE